MSLTAQDIEALTCIMDRSAAAAVDRAMLPVQRELAEIKGRLDQGRDTMKGHREELDEHDVRLDEHDDRLVGHATELAELQPRAPRPGDPTPSRGSATLERRRRRIVDLLTSGAVEKYGPALILLTIGSLLPYFGQALIALGQWIKHASVLTP